MENQSIQEQLDFLRSEIRRHDHLYYIEAKPEISDYEYDTLYRKLREIEAAHPELVTPDSPTQRVSGNPLTAFQTVRHKLPMMSLDNTYDANDLRRFHEYVVKGLGGDMPTLMASLAKLVALSDETRVVPGHGQETTIASERHYNPFLQ